MTTLHSYPCTFNIETVNSLTPQEIVSLIEQKYPKDVFDKYIIDHIKWHDNFKGNQCRGNWRLEITFDEIITTTTLLKFRIVAVGDSRNRQNCFVGCGKYNIVNPKAYALDSEKYNESLEAFQKSSIPL